MAPKRLRHNVPQCSSLWWSHLQPVDPCCRIVEQLCLFVRRIMLRETFEGIPQHIIAATDLIDRKVRFKHAALDPKLLYGMLVIGPGCLHQGLRGRRPVAFMPAKPIDFHIDPPKFGDNVGALCELRDGLAPRPENLVVFSRIGADAERAAEMVEDDRGVRESPRQVCQFSNLGMVAPAFETHLVAREMRISLAKSRVEIQVWRWHRTVLDRRAG